MMGRSHVVSGAMTGMLTGHGVNTLPGVELGPAAICGLGIISAGAAALPDLDHPHSSASRILGPLSGLLSWLVRGYARVLYLATRGPGDPLKKGAHRGATHSIPLLIPPCLIVGALPRIWPQAGAVLVWTAVGFATLVAADRLDRWLPGWVLILVGVASAVSLDAELGGAAPWVALAILVGTITHVLGDAVTEYGVPLWAPLDRRNPGTPRERRWVRRQLPAWLAFKTNGWFERWVVLPALGLGTMLVIPGISPIW